MLNNVIIVGRLTKDVEVIESENGTKRSYITLAVNRSFKNADGEVETDFINVILWNNLAENVCEYCKKGDVIGIKGRIEVNRYVKDDETKYVTEVVAERLTFLSSKKSLEEEK